MKPSLILTSFLAATVAGAHPAAPTAAPAAHDSPAATADNLDTLAQQAPNAVAWVLAPLDAAVPADIRQNLTYLREALLDEAAKTSAAGAAAYKVGEQLCNTMIGALDERDRTRARAGFRAVEAKTRTGVSDQALEAKRNYKMSWPQFVREQAQRDELKNQANNSAAVIAERPKLDWSQRADQIRPTLDVLYKQFREALRKIPGRTATSIAALTPAVIAAVVEKVPPRAAESAAANLFVNANFTAGKEGWSIGRTGNVTIDTKELCNGRPSVRIINAQGTRTMIMQKIQVQPNSRYLLTGYVKTKDVIPVRGPMTKNLEEGAELVVDGPLGGSRRSVRIANTTSNWTQLKYTVLTGEAETEIEVGFALGHYYGPVTGTAWFSEVSLTDLGQKN